MSYFNEPSPGTLTITVDDLLDVIDNMQDYNSTLKHLTL
jgi:hypothetical protein